MSSPEAATEIVADVAEEVAEQATHIAEVSRGLAGRDLGLVFGGFIAGAGLGGILSFIFSKRMLETKYNKLAAEEIAEMRDHYNAKAIALENTIDKPALETVVRESGYVPTEEEEEIRSSAPPMAVTPPTAVTDRAQEIAESEDEVAGEPPDVPIVEEPVTRNVFRDHEPPEDNWDWHKERAGRSPLRPFVIHRDEREEQEAYDSVTFTYYEEDDVVCNENDDVIAAPDRERIIGEPNLEKFGHGSGDASIVYIRNPQLEMDIEVVRSPNSYAEEVHGFEPGEPEIRHTGRRDRMSPDDD